MQSLTTYLSEIFGNAFDTIGLDCTYGSVRVSDRPDLCQFQCNGALTAAKAAKKNPREIAQNIVEIVDTDLFENLELAGPGFINITLKKSFISKYLADNSQINFDDKNQTIVLDYGGPNIAKAMHVAHLRSSIIGDTLRRMYSFYGYKTIGDVHLGDWGLPMGQVISELEIRHPDWPYFDENFDGDYPSESPVTMQDLEEIYPTASKACKEDEDRLEKARQATVDLQNGRKGYRALWQHFIDVSIAGMKENFDALNVHFDLWEGEASVHHHIAPMVEALKHKDLAEDSDGALIVSVEQDDDKKEMPPLILYKSDGAVMYGTTDLATLVARTDAYGVDLQSIIYIVDQRQSLHFEQVFRAARKADIVPDDVALIHAGFGTMNGTDGKPFKTRAGGVMKLKDLIDMATDKANERLKEANLASDMSAEDHADIAHKIAIAAIKFADLQNNRVSDYVFDLDRMTQFEGKTGPYLLYQCVRISSLLAKAGAHDGDAEFLMEDPDTDLALVLLQFTDKYEMAMKQNAPHILCDHIYSLAQAFSQFYGQCHIMSEENAVLKDSRLRLCALTLEHLKLGLELLGIDVPSRM
jgi:arginyl-tRNA synthetase